MGSSRITTPANAGLFLTGDVYGSSVLGLERRYTIPETFSFTTAGTFNSAIQPASGVRLVIVGISLDWPVTLVGQVDVELEVTMAGSDLLGTNDATLGTYAQAIAAAHLAAGIDPGTMPTVHPAPLSIVTSEGDGSTPLYRFLVTNPSSDEVNATVFSAPIYDGNAC